jgi:hypothetical protein
MHRLRDQTVTDVELVLNGDDHHYLDPNLTVTNCRIVLKTNRGALTINDVRFSGCRSNAITALKSFAMWCSASIENCTFTGRYVGNAFGYWPDQAPRGGIKECDFSGAVLDGCRFVGCDIDSIVLPTWPCFAVLHPHAHQREMGAIRWPGDAQFWFAGLSRASPTTVAVVGEAHAVVGNSGGSVEELREALGQLRNVRM